MKSTATVRSPTGRGRPRDPRRDTAILEAAISLIGEIGFDRMTVDAIAARAGVSKPTLYRRWPGGKLDLVGDAIRLHQSGRAESPDTGSLRGDLLALVSDVTGQLLENSHLAAGLAAQLRASPDLAELFREQVIAPDRRRWADVIGRAVERGEIPAESRPSELFAAVAPSVVHTRVLLTGEPVDHAFHEELVDSILLPILLNPTPQVPHRTAS